MIKNDSVLNQEILKGKNYLLLAAINSPIDIPSHTLFQINYMQKIKSFDFECQFKVKKNLDIMNRHFGNIPLSSIRFNDFVLEKLQN
jgi:hypothetical protein